MLEQMLYVAVATHGKAPEVVCAGNSERVIGESARSLVTGGIAKPSDPALVRKMRGVVVLPFADAKRKYKSAVDAFFVGYAC